MLIPNPFRMLCLAAMICLATILFPTILSLMGMLGSPYTWILKIPVVATMIVTAGIAANFGFPLPLIGVIAYLWKIDHSVEVRDLLISFTLKLAILAVVSGIGWILSAEDMTWREAGRKTRRTIKRMFRARSRRTKIWA